MIKPDAGTFFLEKGCLLVFGSRCLVGLVVLELQVIDQPALIQEIIESEVVKKLVGDEPVVIESVDLVEQRCELPFELVQFLVSEEV